MVEFTLTYLDPSALAPEHSHSWLLTCRKDQDGNRVLDCSCGKRRYQRPNDPGDYQDVDRAPGPLFDAATLGTHPFYGAAVMPPPLTLVEA